MRTRRTVVLTVVLACCAQAVRCTSLDALYAAEATVVAAQAPAQAGGNAKRKVRWAALYAHDGRTVLVASGSRLARNSGELVSLDPETGSQVAVLERELGIRSLAMTRDGKRLALGDFDGYAAILEPTTLKVLTTLPQRDQPIYAVAFTPDGNELVTGCMDGTVTFWDVGRGAVDRTLEIPGDRVTGVAVSPDGKTLVVSTWNGQVQLRDYATLQVKHALEGSTVPDAPIKAVEAVAFSPDGTRLVTGCWDKSLRLWDVDTGKVVHEFTGTESAIHSVVFAPDGASLAAGDGRGGVRIWDVRYSGVKMNLTPHSYRCFGLSFSPDGRHLLTASWNGSSQIWDIERRAMLKELFTKNQFGSPQVVQPTPPPAPVARNEFKVEVTTQQGKPLAGVSVVPKIYRVLQGSGGIVHEGVFPPILTNAGGMATIAAPAGEDSPARMKVREAFKTGIQGFDVSIEHPGHPGVFARTDSELVRVMLPDPTRISLRAHRENETKLLPNLEVMVNPRWSPTFTSRSESDEVLTLRNVDLSSDRPVHHLRLAHLSEQGPALFSELLTLPQKGERELEYDVTLKPGVRVAGRLSDDVPRPVKNGHIAASIIRGAQPLYAWNLQLAADITPEGTFVFESLPTGETLQILAYCDGWTSLPARPAEIEAFLVENVENEVKQVKPDQFLRVVLLPQLFRLEGQEIRPLVVMAQNSTCKVRVIDAEQRPLADVNVSFSLTQSLLVGGQSVLGRKFINGLDRQQIRLMNGEVKRTVPYEYPPNPHVGKTDANGEMVMNTLPTGHGPMEFRFSVSRTSSTVYVPPTEVVTIFPGQAGNVTVRMAPGFK